MGFSVHATSLKRLSPFAGAGDESPAMMPPSSRPIRAASDTTRRGRVASAPIDRARSPPTGGGSMPTNGLAPRMASLACSASGVSAAPCKLGHRQTALRVHRAHDLLVELPDARLGNLADERPPLGPPPARHPRRKVRLEVVRGGRGARL